MEGFAYSDAMKSQPGNWDFEALNHFLLNPKSYVAGTKMNFAGLKKDQDRQPDRLAAHPVRQPGSAAAIIAGNSGLIRVAGWREPR